MSQIFEAKESFHCDYNGTPTVIQKGERVREGHPILRGREHMFIPVTVKYDVEDASAAPRKTRMKTTENDG